MQQIICVVIMLVCVGDYISGYTCDTFMLISQLICNKSMCVPHASERCPNKGLTNHHSDGTQQQYSY